MWVLFGAGAVITALCNVAFTMRGRDARWFRFLSLALTALTLCAIYQTNVYWVSRQDWNALMDVVPSMSKALWVLTGASIILNGISLFKKPNK